MSPTLWNPMTLQKQSWLFLSIIACCSLACKKEDSLNSIMKQIREAPPIEEPKENEESLEERFGRKIAASDQIPTESIVEGLRMASNKGMGVFALSFALEYRKYDFSNLPITDLLKRFTPTEIPGRMLLNRFCRASKSKADKLKDLAETYLRAEGESRATLVVLHTVLVFDPSLSDRKYGEKTLKEWENELLVVYSKSK